MSKYLLLIVVSINVYSQPTPIPQQVEEVQSDTKVIMERCASTLNMQMTQKEKVKALDDCMKKAGLIKLESNVKK